MKLSKKNLLSLINENLKEMAMDFDTADRPNPDLQAKLASGDTPLKKIPFPKTGNEPNQNFQELLASERYRQIVNNVRQYTNYQGTLDGTEMGPLLTMMYTAHNNIIRLENTHKEALEQLAIEIVKEEMGIGEEVEFDAKKDRERDTYEIWDCAPPMPAWEPSIDLFKWIENQMTSSAGLG